MYDDDPLVGGKRQISKGKGRTAFTFVRQGEKPDRWWREIDLSHAVEKNDVLWVVCAQGLTIRFRLARPRRIKRVPSKNELNPAYAHKHDARLYLYEPMASYTCAFNLDLYPSECVTIIRLRGGVERRHLVPSASAWYFRTTRSANEIDCRRRSRAARNRLGAVLPGKKRFQINKLKFLTKNNQLPQRRSPSSYVITRVGGAEFRGKPMKRKRNRRF